jgi:hypothetical protein
MKTFKIVAVTLFVVYIVFHFICDSVIDTFYGGMVIHGQPDKMWLIKQWEILLGIFAIPTFIIYLLINKK